MWMVVTFCAGWARGSKVAVRSRLVTIADSIADSTSSFQAKVQHLDHKYREQPAANRYQITGRALLSIGLIAGLFSVSPAFGQTAAQPAASTAAPAEPVEPMSETLRSEVTKTVVVAGDSPTAEEISGTYDKATPGLIGGMAQGSRLGTISQEIGGVNVNFPIPILTVPGAIYGGLSGATKREIQEFRDELTDELARAESQPLANDGLALDVYRELGKLPGLETKLFAPTTPVPEDTDAVLYVKFDELGIDVQGNKAVVTIAAKATLRRASDGSEMYETVVRYQDRDTLSNWTKDDNALWRDYSNFAAHYLAREISAAVFDGISVQHELRPQKTDTAKQDKRNERQFVSRTVNPALAWAYTLAADQPKNAWAGKIDESGVDYDLEIYDQHRLVYVGKQTGGPRHTVTAQLEPCQTYWWSVRPSYRIDGEIRFGDWMRFDSESESLPGHGLAGRDASTAPAYIQDFALLKIRCGAK